MTKNDYDAQERAAKTSENSVKTAQISLLSAVENYKWAVKAWQQPSRKEAACMFLKDKIWKNIFKIYFAVIFFVITSTLES